jgi:hypothetical protein
MGQSDMAWPSEDEDFDAKIDTSSFSKPKTSNASVTSDESQSESAVRRIKPKFTEESVQESAPEASEPEPTSVDEAVANQPEESMTTSESEAAEPTVDESAIQQPEETSSVTPIKPTIDKPSRTVFGVPMWRLVAEGVLVLLVIGLGLWSWSLENDRKDLKSQVSSLNANPQAAVQKQTQTLISEVGQLITLPTNEVPTVANVTDAAQAKQQSAFFTNAQDGDKVLMYVKAGQAILYRPSTNKIIIVAPLTFNNSGTASTAK